MQVNHNWLAFGCRLHLDGTANQITGARRDRVAARYQFIERERAVAFRDRLPRRYRR